MPFPSTLAFYQSASVPASLKRSALILALALSVSGQVAQAEETPVLPVPSKQNVPLTGVLTLDPKLLVQLLVARSAEIEYSRLQVEVAGHLKDAEAALYEAVMFSNWRREGRERQRTAAERQATFATASISVLNERIETSEIGVRNRLPTGGELSLSYKIRDVNNNIISVGKGTKGEYDGSLLLSLKQPLLKGRGRDVVETDRQIADLDERISVYQYRQQLLKTCGDALTVYWQLYRALEVNAIRKQALDNVKRILSDVAARVEAGKAPASAVLDAQAAVLIREVDQIRAEQGVREAEARLQTLLNVSGLTEKTLSLQVKSDVLASRVENRKPEERFQSAVEKWPPLLIAKLRIEQGLVRMNFADNQRLPALDLLVGRSRSGLAQDRYDATSIVNSGRFPEWFVGISLDMPLEDNQKATSQFRAQVARVRQSQLELESVTNSLGNDIRTRFEQALSAAEEVRQMQRDVELRSRMLENERIRYGSGIGQLSLLLQREGDLAESRQRLVESNTRLGQADTALMFADGSLLEEYGVILKD